jgi:hypothetical protein
MTGTNKTSGAKTSATRRLSKAATNSHQSLLALEYLTAAAREDFDAGPNDGFAWYGPLGKEEQATFGRQMIDRFAQNHPDGLISYLASNGPISGISETEMARSFMRPAMWFNFTSARKDIARCRLMLLRKC